MSLKFTNWIFQILILCISTVYFTGCAPSIRYTRSNDGQIHYVVPRDWDYRKNYKVPLSRLESIVESYLNTPYRYAGMSRKGVDCSGFVCLVFNQLNHTKLPHSSKRMSHFGREVSLQQAQAGDLVFFKGGLFGSINHVGILMNEKKFAHASVKCGVIYSSLDENYYREHFAQLRRIF